MGAADYDARVPEAWRTSRVHEGTQTVLVVANAGPLLWEQFRAAPEFALEQDPLDTYTRRVFDDALAAKGAVGAEGAFALYNEKRDDAYLPLVALAQHAGLGSPGRVGVLLHPTYGPWMSLRGLVYVRDHIAPETLAPFDPCSGCPAPCESACPVGVVSASGVDAEGCYDARLTRAGCALKCDARRACVVGPEYAFSREQEAHHAKIRSRARRPDPKTPA